MYDPNYLAGQLANRMCRSGLKITAGIDSHTLNIFIITIATHIYAFPNSGLSDADGAIAVLDGIRELPHIQLEPQFRNRLVALIGTTLSIYRASRSHRSTNRYAG